MDYVRALYDFSSVESDDVSFTCGDVLVFVRDVDENWAQGQLDDKVLSVAIS